MKKIFLNVCFLLSILCLVGCEKKKDMLADDFKNDMENKGFSIADSTSEFNSQYNIEKVYVATSGNASYQIKFFQLSNKKSATNFFKEYRSSLLKRKTNEAVETTDNSIGVDKYTLTVDGKYIVISRINDTVMYLDVDSSYKSEVKNILAEYNY